jgi:glycosyltransferase involved in cell wall biosynthesis
VDGDPMIDFTEGAGCFFPRLSTKDAGLGLNIVGFFRHAFGVAEAARCSARAADAAHIPTAIVPCKIGTESGVVDETWTPRFRDDNPYPVNLFHLDAPQTVLIDKCHGAQFRRSRYNIAYWAWELPEFPDAWLANFDFIDEVWTPSRFVQESIGAKSPVPVHVMPHAVGLPATTPASRAGLGLPSHDLLFLTVFDLGSTQARKNPQAALDAFRHAYPDPRGVHLVVKTQGGDNEGREAEALRVAVAETPGTTLIHRSMSRAELAALQAACDCFVSLHRAEGFGMALAESMLAGRPVIATGWSGNLEFMNPDNSCLVNHRLVEIEHTIGPYKKGQQWAEPDIEHAAWWMRELAEKPARREEIGRAGQAHVREYLAPQRIGELYARRLKALYHWI